jgi:hypothetical protein
MGFGVGAVEMEAVAIAWKGALILPHALGGSGVVVEEAYAFGNAGSNTGMWSGEGHAEPLWKILSGYVLFGVEKRVQFRGPVFTSWPRSGYISTTIWFFGGLQGFYRRIRRTVNDPQTARASGNTISRSLGIDDNYKVRASPLIG